MNKTNITPAFYSATLLSIFLLNGCASAPTETRYDHMSKTYVSTQGGAKSTAGQNDYATDHYVAGQEEKSKTSLSHQNGVKSTAGQYDDVTAHYTLKQGAPHVPKSRIITAPPEKQVADLPMTLEVTDILFEFDKWVIKEPFIPELNEWVDYFQINPLVTAEIYGHTDSTGPTTYNQNLSLKRAQAVINYLVENGVHPNRLTAKGFGESQPTATNNTKEGRQKNRRVDVKL
jgi:outer membrane protein OmpA-like peptidoglycan-associated protein